MSKPIRQFIFETLLPYESHKAHRLHVEDVLNTGYHHYGYAPQDRRFATYLAYGILRSWFLLEAAMQSLSHIPKLAPDVRLLLRMGLYQLAEMDSVPDYAAVSETMALAEALKLSTKSRGFIHAVLQNFIRQGKNLPTDPEIAFPVWWVDRLKAQYSPEDVTQILTAFLKPPQLSIRINTLNISVEEYKAQITQPYASSEVKEVIRFTDAVGDPRQLPGYEEGWFVVQDESSARVAHVLDPKPGETILEIGAAPGMKTTHIAALMQNQGKILAVDISEKRMKLLRENSRRLGVTIIDEANSSIEVDRVLVDAPCSGTGTIGKHPEILQSLAEKDFKIHQQTQLKLLQQGFSQLKSGGVLVYSTCSIDVDENKNVVDLFLKDHNNIDQQQISVILPTEIRDGFFIFKAVKAREC